MDVEAVLGALADPTRRQVLGALAARPAASASALARELPITRQMVVKHLGVLRECGLVSSTKSGREVLFRVRAEPLSGTADWLSSLAARWESRPLSRRAPNSPNDARVSRAGA
jgi:DNA-binding transcriptional ArsR family regulator